jgi:hypothetical protein
MKCAGADMLSILSTGYTSWAHKWTPGRNLLTIKAVDRGRWLNP